ncbi:uncharacterized protein [Macrobrachium rosenbergii]|uniref:uncharacterized protein isoform X2 n=1 Tax=Macrobrachium rosenbergii TaxID=79674 RepID=UPI0034D63BC9
MDASNEFKVLLCPSSASASKGKKAGGDAGPGGVRHRIVPVINKVFSPSHFMLAQRKTTVYKAVSGVSFQDIDIGGKKRPGNKKEKRKGDDTPVSESERSLLSTKSDKDVRSLLNTKDPLRIDARRQRHSLGSYADRSAYHLDSAEKYKHNSNGKKSHGKSALRTRSVSATDNLYITHANANSSEDVPPVRPQRSRSASRLRKSDSRNSVPSGTNVSLIVNSEVSRKSDSLENRERSKKEESDARQVATAKGNKTNTEHGSSELCRSRRKLESPRPERCSDEKSDSKVGSEKDAEEQEGGYFSLEKEEKSSGEIKFIYEALPNANCGEFAENDQCVETIYVCQVFKKESDSEDDEDHIYENYKVIKMTKEGKVIGDDDENYENYQIIRRVREEELLGVDSESSNDGEGDVYERIAFLNQDNLAYTPQTTAMQAREKRHNPLGSNDSIPFIDESDNSLDEEDKNVTSSETATGSITVITINDSNAKISRKASPQRTKPLPLRSQDGIAGRANETTSADKSCDTEKKASFPEVVVNVTTNPGSANEVSCVSTLSSGVQTSSSEASTLDGLSKSISRHSYPTASALIPKLCEKISKNMARLGTTTEEPPKASLRKDQGRAEHKVKKSTSTIDVIGRKSNVVDERVKKSMSQNDVESHLKEKGTGNILSESFSDEDIAQNEDFESFSETDSELDNLDYDMFTPKSNNGKGHQVRKSHLRSHKTRGKTLTLANASPLMTSTPFGTTKQTKEVSCDSIESDGAGVLNSPATFQDLLENKCLNPPETDTESLTEEDVKGNPLVIHEDGDVMQSDAQTTGPLDSRGDTPATDQMRSGADEPAVDDTLSFSWSDAESEFEFIDFKKIEPPKTCVVYQGVAATCDDTAVTTSITTVTTASVRTEKRLGASVKRSQSMKVVGERLSCRGGDGSLRWEPLLCVLPEGLTASHGGGLVRSVSGVSIRRSVRVDGSSRYTAASHETSDVILKSCGEKGSVGGAHLKHDRNSAPSSPQLAASRSADSTPSKFNLWSRINKKTKGSFKPEKKNSRSEEGSTEISDGSLRSARSHESLQSCIQSHDSVLLHSSFHDRTRIQVNRDETRRTENTLMIWIMEAKDIPSKKKYFCRLKLNNELYRCTHKKQMTTMCFWGEYFELDSLPQVSTICIELMREADKKPTVKTIGSVEINVTLSSPGRAALIENWYLVKVEKQDRGDVPSIRIKHKFQSLDILPLVKYNALRSYLKDNSTSLCQLLEPAISVKAKEDIATTLIHIMQAEQRAVTFLVNLILIDTQKKAESEHLLFRGNSVATKAIEAYMKLVGEQYLCDLLSEPIYSLITTSEDLEVDPLRITSLQSLQRQREALKERVSEIWEKIIKSSTSFPVELRKVFHTLREHLAHQGKGEMTDHLISACVFLRFLCPAVLSPSLFNIVQEYPDEGVARNLTLVTKTLQTLANFTHFQGKESFMEFLNEFINKEQDRCRDFLQAISSPSDEDTSELEFSGDIDLGKHLALLHLHLIDALAKINTQGYESEASKVLALVEDISALLGDDCKENQPVTCHLPTLNPISTPPLVSNPSALATPTHLNNNYVRDYGDGNIGVGMVGGGIGAGYGVPITTVKSQSLPRSAPPIYQHHMEIPSPGLNSPYREKTAANDLSTNDDYVLITAFDHHAQPQNFMYPSVEANNNATLTDIRHSNGNTYFMAEVLPPDSPVCSSGSPAPYYTSAGQPPLRTYHHNQGLPRRHQRTVTTTSRSHSVQSPMERRGPYQEELSELYNFMDSCSHQIDAVCMDHENNIQGSQTSISQLSNVASSGYQSFAYSQSSSPVDSLLQTDNSSLLSRENGNPAQPILRQVLHGSPLASPLHQPAIGKHRAVAVHPAYLGHAGHVSLHGTPRHIPRVPQSKGSPNSSLSSSQSVEDLSSLRRGRTRQRRSASSSSDSSPESRPAMHAHSRRPNAHPPRTNPHCSPRLIPSPALRQELRSRSRCDRSVSGGRRGKNFRSCDREEFTRGTSHCYEDSEDDLAGMNYVSGGAGGGGGGGGGGGSWRRDGRRLSQEDYQCKSLAPQQILEQQEGQMRAIVEKSEEMKGDIPDDINGDSCNASDTSDYKSSSC